MKSQNLCFHYGNMSMYLKSIANPLHCPSLYDSLLGSTGVWDLGSALGHVCLHLPDDVIGAGNY